MIHKNKVASCFTWDSSYFDFITWLHTFNIYVIFPLMFELHAATFTPQCFWPVLIFFHMQNPQLASLTFAAFTLFLTTGVASHELVAPSLQSNGQLCQALLQSTFLPTNSMSDFDLMSWKIIWRIWLTRHAFQPHLAATPLFNFKDSTKKSVVRSSVGHVLRKLPLTASLSVKATNLWFVHSGANFPQLRPEPTSPAPVWWSRRSPKLSQFHRQPPLPCHSTHPPQRKRPRRPNDLARTLSTIRMSVSNVSQDWDGFTTDDLAAAVYVFGQQLEIPSSSAE